MKTTFAFQSLKIAILLSIVSTTTFASECVDEFAGLQKLYSTYENQKSKLWDENRAQAKIYAEASNALRNLIYGLGIGSRTDLGESEKISFLVLSDKDESQLKTDFQDAIKVLNKNPLTQKDSEILEEASKKIKPLNLLNPQNSQSFRVETLSCLGGKPYLHYIEAMLENKKLGLVEKTISNFEKEKNEAWKNAVLKTVKEEESLWGDTILEGDIGQNGPANAEEISVVLLGNKIILTRIFIQAPAVFTGNGECEYDDKKKEWVGEECGEGSISVTKLLDLNNNLVGDDNFAEFDN